MSAYKWNWVYTNNFYKFLFFSFHRRYNTSPHLLQEESACHSCCFYAGSCQPRTQNQVSFRTVLSVDQEARKGFALCVPLSRWYADAWLYIIQSCCSESTASYVSLQFLSLQSSLPRASVLPHSPPTSSPKKISGESKRKDFLNLLFHKNNQPRDFPGGPVAKTPHSQCSGSGFNPWSGN